MMTLTADAPSATTTLDALVIGAGVAGLYQVYQLRELGLNVHGYEAGGDVGGTWYWNRYPVRGLPTPRPVSAGTCSTKSCTRAGPGAKFPGQPEIEQWLHYVTDQLELRDDYTFNTRIQSAVFNEDTGRWLVATDTGETIDTGCSSPVPACCRHRVPMSSTARRLRRQIVFTSRWPKEATSKSGQRASR